MNRQISRRGALQSISAATVGLTLLPAGSARAYATNEKLNIALVGCGGRGSWFVKAIPQIGEIRQVLVWNASGGGGPRPIPQQEMTTPDYLKWDLWLGPGKQRPYHKDWMRWHGWREFGTSQLGNWSVHSTNMQFMAFRVDELWYDESLPVDQRTIRVRAEISGIDHIGFPKWEIVHYDIPARGALPAYTVTWLNGLAAPKFRETIEPPLGHRLIAGGPGPWHEHAGCLVVGSGGTIHSTGHNSTYTLLPEDKFASYQKPEPTLPRHGSHEREWLAACRGDGQAMSNFDYGAVLTEFILLGNVATQFDRPIRYDPVTMQCLGDEDANAALRREHRGGWEIS